MNEKLDKVLTVALTLLCICVGLFAIVASFKLPLRSTPAPTPEPYSFKAMFQDLYDNPDIPWCEDEGGLELLAQEAPAYCKWNGKPSRIVILTPIKHGDPEGPDHILVTMFPDGSFVEEQ